MLEATILNAISAAGIAFLVGFCLSPVGIFWRVSVLMAKSLGVNTDELSKDEIYEALTTEKNIFFAFGLCNPCFGFWLSLVFGIFSSLTLSPMVLIYTIGATQLIIKVINQNGQ